MKRKGLILILIVLFCLFFSGVNNASAANTGDWVLVTDVAQLKIGDQIVIVASGSNYALGTTQNTNNRKAESITKNNSSKTVAITDKIQKITLKNGTKAGTFAFYTGSSGYLYAASSSSNNLKTKATLDDNGSWDITVTSAGVATIKAQGTNTRNLLKKNSSSTLFSCYGSGQNDVSIYRLVTAEDINKPSFELTNKPTSSLLVGTTHTLVVANLVSCTTDQIVWTSENENIATVSKGVITAVSIGKTKINASVNGEIIASCDVSVYSHDGNLRELVNTYYNNGIYTKKTEIHLTEGVWETFETLLHKKATPNRTTYYNGEYLLMGDYDGGFDEINSGYMNEGNDMAHFKYSGNLVDPIANKYVSVKNTSIQDYYVALDDMIDNEFFNGWNPINDGATKCYKYVIGTNENLEVNQLVHDFLWFTAPGLSDLAFSNSNGLGNFISQDNLTLIVEEKTNDSYGPYLSLRIVLDVLMAGFVRTDEELQSWKHDEETGAFIVPDGEELTLAEARVYKGNISFDEQQDVNELYVEEAINSIYKKYILNDTNQLNQKLVASLSLDPSYSIELFGKRKSVNVKWNCVGTIEETSIVNNSLLYNNPSEDNNVTLTATVSLENVTETYSFEVKQLKYVKPAETVELAVFEFGSNGTATHKDGSTEKTTYSETVNGYTLSLTNGSKMYPSSYDAKGNSCIKFGSSSAAGKFTLTVPEEVTEVIIYVAQYKKNTTKITVNGTSYTPSTLSDNGEYTAIVVNTSINKTITFATMSGGYRCMMNSIVFKGNK